MNDDSGQTPERRTQEARVLLAQIDAKLEKSKRLIFIVRQMEFLNKMRGDFRMYGDRARVSPRQLFYLRDLRDRAGL